MHKFLIIFLIAWLVRFSYIQARAITFSFDQARDAYIAGEVLKGDLKIQGPPTSTRDFFHGVLFYYLLAAGYAIGSGSPLVATGFLAAISSLGAIPVYLLTKKVTGHELVSILAGFLFSVSYEQAQYATYLSNTLIASATVPLLYLGLYLWHQNKKIGPIIAGLGWGLSIQSNFFLLYHLPVILLLLVIKILPATRKNLLSFSIPVLLCISTFIVSEAKFGFPSRVGIQNLLTRREYTTQKVGLPRLINTYKDQFILLLSNNLFPGQPIVAAGLFVIALLGLVFQIKKNRGLLILLLGLFSSIPALFFGGVSTPYINVGLGSLVIVVLAVTYRNFFVPVVILLSCFHLAFISANLHRGQAVFSIQKDMLLSRELEAIDYMYKESGGEPFSINSITAPLYINTTWSYLFNWYGKSKYGFVPFWHGHSQAGSLGDNLSTPPKGIERTFMIIEPSQGLPQDIINQILEEEKGYSSFNHAKQFGEITIQNRSSTPQNVYNR